MLANDASDVQWWAKRTLGKHLIFKNENILKKLVQILLGGRPFCPRVDPEFSYLLPIKTKENQSISLIMLL